VADDPGDEDDVMRSTCIIVLCALVALVAGCGGTSDSGAKVSPRVQRLADASCALRKGMTTSEAVKAMGVRPSARIRGEGPPLTLQWRIPRVVMINVDFDASGHVTRAFYAATDEATVKARPCGD
jgi:hypothetical protein